MESAIFAENVIKSAAITDRFATNGSLFLTDSSVLLDQFQPFLHSVNRWAWHRGRDPIASFRITPYCFRGRMKKDSPFCAWRVRLSLRAFRSCTMAMCVTVQDDATFGQQKFELLSRVAQSLKGVSKTVSNIEPRTSQ